MKKQIGLLLLCCFASASGQAARTAEIIAPIIAAYTRVEQELSALPAPKNDSERLIRMRRIDEAGRNAYVELNLGSLPDDVRAAAFTAARQEIDRRDANHAAQLKAMLPPSGWFLRSEYGEEGAAAAWLIVQHAIIADKDLLRLVRASMEKLLPTGEINKKDFAMLDDRVAIRDVRRQRFGTQMICRSQAWVPYPIEGLDGLETRRREMGIREALAEQLAQVNNRSCPSEFTDPLPK